MKVLKFLSVLFILFSLFTITSCVNEPLDPALLDSVDNGGGTDGGGTGGGGTGTGGGTTTGYYLRVKKDGVLKQYTSIEALNTRLLNSFIISGDEGANTLIFTLLDVSTIGVYEYSWAEISCSYTEGSTEYNTNYSDLTTSTGNITISEINRTNKTIKGTFNFIGKNEALSVPKVFTNGEFFLKYIEL